MRLTLDAFLMRTHYSPLLALALVASLLLRGAFASDLILIGDDTAGYLTYVEGLKGNTEAPGAWWHHGIGAAYILPFTLALGTFKGAWLAALVSSILLAIPLFLWAKRVLHPALAVCVALLAIWGPETAFLLSSAWMYLLSMAIGIAGLYAAVVYHENRDRLVLIISIALILSLAFTNQSALMVAGPVALIVWLHAFMPSKYAISLFGVLIIAVIIVFTYGNDLRGPLYFLGGSGLIALSLGFIKNSSYVTPAIFAAIVLLWWSVLLSLIIIPDSQALQGLFARALAWVYVSGGLLLAFYLKGFKIKKPVALAIAAFVLVIGIGGLWLSAFVAMAQDHSTLTNETLPGIEQTTRLKGIIGVHPFMMARYVAMFDETKGGKKIIKTFPEGVPVLEKQRSEDLAIRCAMAIAKGTPVNMNLCLNALSIDFLVLKNGDVVEIHDLRGAGFF